MPPDIDDLAALRRDIACLAAIVSDGLRTAQWWTATISSILAVIAILLFLLVWR